MKGEAGKMASGGVIMLRALREHWPEYLCEAAELGLFMISAGLFTILLHHPSSPVLNFIPSEFTRRMLTGTAMGSTGIAAFWHEHEPGAYVQLRIRWASLDGSLDLLYCARSSDAVSSGALSPRQ